MASLADPITAGDSFISRIDPRIRLVCAAAITLPVAVLNIIDPAWIALATGIAFVFLARITLSNLLKRLCIINLFILFLWLFIPFSQPGEFSFSIGPFNATHEGISLALLISIKSNAIVLILMSLMGTIAIQDLGPAMQQLKIPNKLCHILLFTYRYIFVIHQEYTTMCRAMQARGFKPKTNTHTYRSYAWLVGMLLIKSWDRAERVHGAMRCRGFQGRFYTLAEFNTGLKDYIFLAASLLLALGLIFTELAHRGLI
ncbi:MAG: cobalt ECF transporter T component CbiQ [Pseudodesulfovibrio sp.]|nr:cobalt ECF transporter T component CbiQ [Pseudodesulfovibrio sp.]